VRSSDDLCAHAHSLEGTAPHTPVNSIQLSQYMVQLEYVYCKCFPVNKIFDLPI